MLGGWEQLHLQAKAGPLSDCSCKSSSTFCFKGDWTPLSPSLESTGGQCLKWPSQHHCTLQGVTSTALAGLANTFWNKKEAWKHTVWWWNPNCCQNSSDSEVEYYPLLLISAFLIWMHRRVYVYIYTCIFIMYLKSYFAFTENVL